MSNEITITPLGTVSPYCKGNQNCPGFLINYKNKKILLDCGNGISRLLNLPEDLKDLSIFISHLHKDHYGDLLSLGYASYVYQKLGIVAEKVNLFIPDYPKNVKKTVYYEEKMSDAEFLDNFGEEHNFNFNYFNVDTNIEIDDLKVSFATNPHSIMSYAIKLESPQGSIVYSGDTGFKKNILESFAKDVDLLICESTFLKGQARAKDEHLYAYEAADIAKKASVKQLMLTHFWPEMPKSIYLEEAKEVFQNTIVAEENKKLVLKK